MKPGGPSSEGPPFFWGKEVEAADTLSEYGTIDEERIEEIRDARERTEAREEAAARNAEEYVPPAAGTQPQEEGPARRFILCPKCGERIWL